jgi:hypothetical protein
MQFVGDSPKHVDSYIYKKQTVSCYDARVSNSSIIHTAEVIVGYQTFALWRMVYWNDADQRTLK